MNRNRLVLTAAFAATAIGAGGLVVLAIPAGAGSQPNLPPVSAQELVESAMNAQPPAMHGKVEVNNALGLPSLPNLPQIGAGESTIRVWSDGGERSRLALPSGGGERTIINDGTTIWAWDSDSRTAAKLTEPSDGAPHGAIDPATAARALIGAVQPSSSISVDGTAKVAGRAAYELVLAPAPTERTLLREVRAAVDAETRMPLRLQVLAHGSAEPVFQVGFTDLDLGPQKADLFTFTPPKDAEIVEEGDHPGAESPMSGLPEFDIVGDGWDIVLVTELPSELGEQPDTDEPRNGPFGPPHSGDFDLGRMLGRIGTPVSGPWGEGHLVTTAVASAIITDDGRIAAGAVPEQVLTEALSR